VAVLHLVRHAEPGADGSLTGLGRRQAQALAERLTVIGVAAVHHGPSPRTGETARLLGEQCGVPVHVSTRLGDLTPTDPAYPPPLRDFLARIPPDERDPGGERLNSAIAHFRSAGEAVLVTHAYVVGWFVRSALDTPTDRWMQLFPDHASLTSIDYTPEGPPRVLRFNDTGHLR
jgi:probable phosphoglycerate mutase